MSDLINILGAFASSGTDVRSYMPEDDDIALPPPIYVETSGVRFIFRCGEFQVMEIIGDTP